MKQKLTYADIKKHPLSIGNILDIAWILFKENFKPILFITLIIYIPLNLFMALADYLWLAPTTSDPLENLSMFWRMSSGLEGLIGIIATMVIAWLIKMRLDGKKITYQQALSKSASRWPAALGTNIVMGIFLLGLFILFIVPGIIFANYWAFAIFVVLFEDISFTKALKSSKEIVQGRWWRTLGFFLVFGVLGVVLSIFTALPSFVVSSVLDEAISAPFVAITDVVIDIGAAFFTVVTAIFYLNMRETKISTKKKK